MNSYYFKLNCGKQIYQFLGNIELHVGQKIRIIDTYYRVISFDEVLVIQGNNQMSCPTKAEIFCIVEEIK